MPVILRDSAGNRYLYGLDLISVSDSANTKTYYHTDGLGSTTAITSSTGAVAKTYQYDVFGAVRAQTGTQPNEFTFTGEQNDSSGLEYLRARYYDSATGRFVGRDPLPNSQRYPYVGNNPANAADPSGLCAEGPFLVTSCSVNYEAHGVGRYTPRIPVCTPQKAPPFANCFRWEYDKVIDLELSVTFTSDASGHSTVDFSPSKQQGQRGWRPEAWDFSVSDNGRSATYSQGFHTVAGFPFPVAGSRVDAGITVDIGGTVTSSGAGPHRGPGGIAALLGVTMDWTCFTGLFK